MEFVQRQRRLQQRMKEQDVQGYFVTQNVDIYYLTGSMQSGYLFIPCEGDPRFYVRRSVIRAQQEAACETVPLGSFRNFANVLANDFPQLFQEGSTLHFATEFDVLPVQVFQRLQNLFPQVNWVDGSIMMRELRMVKSYAEIEKIKESARIVNKALEFALSRIKEGMTELELISLIEQSIRLDGHIGLMRMRGYNQELVTGMVTSGAAAARPTYFDGPAGGEGLCSASPQGAGKKVLAKNEPILVDIGCCIDGYVIDQTRTVVIGQCSDELVHAYEIAESVLRQTEEKLKPGTVCEQLYLDALEHVEKHQLSEHFMGYGADQVRFLGHGIGLEIDEFPVLAKGFTYPLQPGMVIAIEPKFTFPGQGVVGIENTYAITDHGYEKLTISREGIIYV